MREKWTDERLDDLSGRVEVGFAQVERNLISRLDSMEERFDSRLDSMGGRLDSMEKRFDSRFDSMEGRLGSIEERFDSMQRTMLQGAIALSGAMLAGFGGMIALLATQV